VSKVFQNFYDLHMNDAIYNFYFDILKPIIEPTSIVIDCGCGSGRLTQRLESLTQHVYAFDIDTHMIELASKKTNYTQYKVLDMHHAWPFYGDVIIMSLDVINFSNDPLKVLNRAIDALMQEGIIILDLYNPSDVINIDEHGKYPVTYHWKAKINNQTFIHNIYIDQEKFTIHQYLHDPNMIIDYMHTFGFNVDIKQSIDPRKHILIFQR
jgi:2-polyprenyl-3-methyl-5-hydroxy-6-metoxy-1,4-benzoquinol methylase